MVSITLFLMAGCGLVLSKKLLGDYFSPPAIYNFFWTFALGFLMLNWVSYDPMRVSVWTVILLSYAGFMSACLIVTLYGFSKSHWLTAEPRFHQIDRHKLERALLFLFLLGILGFLIQVTHLQAQIGLDTFLSDPRAAREQHTNVKYLGLINILNVANFVLALMYLFLYKKPKKWVVFILIWALATTFLTTDRTRFFYMVIWGFYIAVFVFRHFNLTPRVIAGITTTFLVLLGFFLLIAKVYKKEAFEDNMEYINIPAEYALAVDPYIYMTGSFPVLQAFLDDKRELAWGKSTFDPVVKVIELFYPEFERAELVGKFYRVPIELNASTYLEPYYKDFGMMGVFIGPFLTGLLCMWCYVAMRQRRTLFSVYITAVLCFCTTISIFVNHYTQLSTWYFILTGYLVYRFCHTDQPQQRDDFRNHVYGV